VLVRGLHGSETMAVAISILSGSVSGTDTAGVMPITGSASALGAAHIACLKQLKSLLASGRSVVLHGTFHQNWEINIVRNVVRERGVRALEIVDLFDAGLDDETLASRAGVRPTTVARMRAQWETLTPTDLEVHAYGKKVIESSRKRWLHLVRGLPGCGKNERATQIIEERGVYDNECVVLSSRQTSSHSMFLTRVQKALRCGFNVVVPDVCLQHALYVERFQTIADSCGVQFRVTDLGDGGRDDHQLVAKSRYGATLEAIRDARKRYEPSDRQSPGWKAWSLAREREHSEHMASLQQAIDRKMDCIQSNPPPILTTLTKPNVTK